EMVNAFTKQVVQKYSGRCQTAFCYSPGSAGIPAGISVIRSLHSFSNRLAGRMPVLPCVGERGKAAQGFFLPKRLDQTDLVSTCRCWTFNWPRMDCNPM